MNYTLPTPLRVSGRSMTGLGIVICLVGIAGACSSQPLGASASDAGDHGGSPGGNPGSGQGGSTGGGNSGSDDAGVEPSDDAGSSTEPGAPGDDDAGTDDGGSWDDDGGPELPTGPAYYVATSGSDSNTGTDANHPFLTIGKAASAAKAGDTVVIRAGVYRETVTLSKSGTAGSPITFQNYPGETATISGADVIPTQSWKVHSGKIYQAAISWTQGVGMDQVFVDGVMMNEARWPNTTLDVSHPKAATAGSVSGTSSLTMNDAALTQGAGSWKGARMNMGAGKDWIYKTFTITGSNPGQLTFTADTSNANYAPTAGNLYYLWGTLAALDTAGEAFHDATAKLLYLWTPKGDSPAAHLVEAKRRAYAFDFGSQSYIVLRGVRIFSATVTMGSASHNNLIDHVAARYVSHAMVLDGSYGANAGTTGLQISGTNQTVQNCAVSFSSGDGVSVTGNGNKVSNCRIHDVDYATTDCAAINPHGSNITVEKNTLFNAGRSLMLFKVQGSKAVNNLIYGAGIQADDLAGIYTYGTDGAKSVIAYNVVHSVRPPNQHKGMAIYLDNGSSNYIVHHNLGYDLSDDGMIINTVSTNNLIYNNTYVGGIHGGGTDPGVQIINNIFTGAIKIGTGATVKNNLVGPTNPKFVDAGAGNYQLQSGSPAIDMGAVLPPYTDGYSGSAPDLGAFEKGAAPWTAGSSVTSDGF